MDLANIHDLALVLPPEGKRRFIVLSDAVSDGAAIGSGFSSQILDKMDDKDRARRRRAEIKALHPTITDDHESIREQDRLIAEADAALTRLNVRAETHLAMAGPRANLLRDVKDWIRKTAPGHDLVDIELVDPPKLGKNETPDLAAQRTRRRLRELDADAHRVNSAPYPSATSKAVIANYINELANAAMPVVSNAIEFAGPLVVGSYTEPPVVFAKKQVEFEKASDAERGKVPDVLGLMAFLFKDQMLARVNELVDAEYDPSTRDAALSHEQRREQLATISSDRAAIELEEAYWLWQSFAGGVVVEPRATMDVAAFLMVQAIRVDRRPGFDHADELVRARRAVEAAEGGPTMPGMTS